MARESGLQSLGASGHHQRDEASRGSPKYPQTRVGGDSLNVAGGVHATQDTSTVPDTDNDVARQGVDSETQMALRILAPKNAPGITQTASSHRTSVPHAGS